MAIATSSLLVFMSVILFVVVNLSNLARGVDVRSLSYERRKPMEIRFVLGDSIDVTLFEMTNLGRLPVIHWINLLILPFSALVVFYWANGVIGATLTLLIVPVYLFLPFLEIEGYDLLTADGTLPTSFVSHLGFSTFQIFLIFVNWVFLVIGELTLELPYTDIRPVLPLGKYSMMITTAVLLVTPVIMTARFSKELQSNFNPRSHNNGSDD